MKNNKKLNRVANINGLGWNHVDWQHSNMPAAASENIDFFNQQIFPVRRPLKS